MVFGYKCTQGGILGYIPHDMFQIKILKIMANHIKKLNVFLVSSGKYLTVLNEHQYSSGMVTHSGTVYG
jgi:hypothetical protein